MFAFPMLSLTLFPLTVVAFVFRSDAGCLCERCAGQFVLGLLATGAPHGGVDLPLLFDAQTLIAHLWCEEIDASLRVDVELARFIWQ